MLDNPAAGPSGTGLSAIEIDLVDEARAGRVSRREFIRAASVIGLSLPIAALPFPVIAAVPHAAVGIAGTTAAKKLGTIRVAALAPGERLDPTTLSSEGGVLLVGQTGEYLTWSNDRLQLEPRLGTSWKPNSNATKWTFAIRKGVRFHNGRPLTADDVVATFERLSDPANASYALSVFAGVLSKGSTLKIDTFTVTFNLDVPHANFPYLVSSDNANAVILPKDYTGDWDRTFIGTGPWVLTGYAAGERATFKRNSAYWDRARIPRFATLALSLYNDESDVVRQLQAGQIDAIAHVGAATGQSLATDPTVLVQSLRTSSHRQIHLRNDGVFADRRVRQAFALTLDREAMLLAMTAGRGDLGNDSPFAPAFGATEGSVPQRKADLARARQLMKDAGAEAGFEVQLDSWPANDVSALAARLAMAAIQIGISIRPSLTPDYSARSWLDSQMGITDYRHRGAPNFVLWSALRSVGSWNAAHYRSMAFDGLVQDFNAALDVQSQKTTAKRIEEMLLDDTPIVVPYFANHVTAVRRGIVGVRVTGAGHLDVVSATKT